MRKVCSLAVAIAIALPIARTARAESIVVPAGTAVPVGYRQIADYGSFGVFDGDAGAMPALAWLMPDRHVLKFDRMPIDTRGGTIVAPAGWTLKQPDGSALQVVQFVGPIDDRWLTQLRDAGAVPIQYIESNGYLVWADSVARAKLKAMVDAGQFLQFSQPLPAFIKLGNSLFDRLQRDTGDATVPVIVQRYRHDGALGRERITALGLKPLDDWTPQLAYEIARFDVSSDQLRELIELPDVFWIGENLPRTLNDEVQAQLIRGAFNADQSGPIAPGYLPWLTALGFPNDPDAYPVLDITDSGIGDRTTMTGDPTLHRFGDDANATRMIYNQACTAANGDVDGHGHLNANIALGYDVRENAATPGARFPGEYQRGQGMNPFGRFGGTRVFAPTFDQSACGGSDSGVIAASYAAGARISSNSWGCALCAGQYDISSQAYDAGTRDADSSTAGNQQLITIFSAGNNGAGPTTVGSPGNGKNMITVGAAENTRPDDEDGPWGDGCQVDSSGADNAMDMIFFSSRGPAPGGRVKPDLVAPGTHVTGTQAHPGVGNGICDAKRPAGNTTYAASSGTSHSTPAVSGVASLSWWWLATGQGSLEVDAGSPSAPSPALMKAWLVAHPTYLTGKDANDTLPSNAQGFGMPNLGDLFGTTPNFLVDQNILLANTGQVWTTQVRRVDAARPMRIVLAWTDAPGAVGTSPQVNNLDLQLAIASETYYGNRFNGAWSVPGGGPDANNNVEAVFLPPGSTEPMTIAVRAINIAGDGVPGNGDATDQDFALVCSNCAKEPSFSLAVAPASRKLCTATTASTTFALTTQSVLGFSTPAAITVAGNPAGTSTSLSNNPIAVPGSSTLTLGGLVAAAAGNYTVAIRGQAGAVSRTRYVQLGLVAAAPAAASPLVPVDNAGNIDRHPLLNWTAAPGADEYRVELARDAAFTQIVYSTITRSTTHTVAIELDYATRYYWRVTALNTCGESLASPASSFTTTPPPGECAADATPTPIYRTDFEEGFEAWTHSGDHDTWAWTMARAHGPGHSVLAQDVAYDSDQRLVSPPILLPEGQAPLTLQFWNHQTIEDRIGGCYDGALLEISTDAGTKWNQVPNARLLVGPYKGPISASFNNPARGKQAWCGDPQDWSRYIVDLDEHAGETVQFRFRLATDASTGRVPEGFYLDDVEVQGCVAAGDGLFADGFE